MARVDDPRIAAAAGALPPGAPDGGEFRYEVAFETLEAEVRRGDKEGPNAVNWPSVGRQAIAILEESSKDLMVAAWFAVAVARTEGLAGLAVGLAVVHDVAAGSWETMFPPKNRERARVQAIEWLAIHAARTLPEVSPDDPGPAAASALADVGAIEDLFAAKLVKEQVSLGELTRGLRPMAEAARRAAAEREAVEAAAVAAPVETMPPAPTAGGAAAAAAAGVGAAAAAPRASSVIAPVSLAVGADAGVDKALAAVRTAVRDVALSLLGAALGEARAYALLRAVTWIEITEAPPSSGGKTGLMPPPGTRLTEFAAMRAAGNGVELVPALEKFLSGSGQFWLDGQRMVHQALLAMGPGYAPAAREVARGVALAIERLPFLPDLVFQDGTPFADSATRAWIEREASLSSGAAAGPGEAAPWVEGAEAARGLVAEGKLEDALALLAGRGAAAGSGRARFRWRLALARLCLDQGHARVALPVLRQAAVDAAAVEAWEPEAAAEGALLLHRCLTMPGGVPELDGAEQTRELAGALSILARIDPVNAIRALRVSG